MNIFLRALNQIATDRWFSEFLASFSWRKFKIKFLLASMKSLTSFDNPSGNPLQETCSGLQVAVVLEAAFSESWL